MSPSAGLGPQVGCPRSCRSPGHRIPAQDSGDGRLQAPEGSPAAAPPTAHTLGMLLWVQKTVWSPYCPSVQQGRAGGTLVKEDVCQIVVHLRTAGRAHGTRTQARPGRAGCALRQSPPGWRGGAGGPETHGGVGPSPLKGTAFLKISLPS